LYKLKILSGYRISIPREVRERFGLKVGDEIYMEVSEGKIILKVKSIPEDPVFSLIGLVGEEERKIKDVEKAVVEEVEDKISRS